eukprot:CAMPEP_0116876536 /NCGR_PEP_ID=MMETSP0463-20121206/8451_1 /TAXON_ID=181622 /ORGANISM="Strombidinopsis sp, Strain SopsisLIS2011" /LENGTH=65 /DNA_ID=CAMNT_0004523185 /DNA_START=42 /DNA_END=239 /DNA_ORIENTATION=+
MTKNLPSMLATTTTMVILLCLMLGQSQAETKKIVQVFDTLNIYGPMSDLSDTDVTLQESWNMTSF